MHDTALTATPTTPVTAPEQGQPFTVGRPAVLPGRTVRIDTPVGAAHITVNGGIAGPHEVIINAGKVGSDVAADAEAIARLVSLVLQLPDGLTQAERAAAVVAQLQGIGSARSVGFGKSRVGSLADAVAKALAGE